MQHELVRAPFEPQNGFIAVPEGPGLGIDVDEKVLQRYAF